MIETQYFTTSPQRYVRSAMGVWLGRYGWIGWALTGILMLAGIRDARFIIVAAALVLLAYPGVMMLVYFRHALTQEAAYGVIPHKVRIDPSRLEIIYQGGSERPTPPSRTIAKEEIAAVEDTGSSMKITLKSGRYSIIDIPADSFSGHDFATSIELLSKNV